MFKIFSKHLNIIIAISEKKNGPMKFSPDNRENFLRKLGIEDKLTVKAGLVHENNVKVVSDEDAGKTIEKTDGLITADKSLFLTITVADCLPIFIFDSEKEIIGLIHGGWRGLAKNILAEAVKNLSKDILVGIGPGISQCHFEVKQDVLREFKPYLKDTLLKRDGKLFLDLKKIAKLQLIDIGIKPENIEISPECTFCLQNKYFSFRRDKPQKLQTMLALIGRK